MALARSGSKKGNLIDILYIPIGLIALFVIILIGRPLMSGIAEEMNDTTTMGQQAVDIVDEANSKYVPTFDYIFLFVFIGLQLGLLITAFWIRTHPVYFVVALVLMVIFTFVTFILSDFADDFGMSEELVSAYDEFKIMRFFIQQLPIFEIVFGFIALMVLYAKGEYG